jgi:hypothetical protein
VSSAAPKYSDWFFLTCVPSPARTAPSGTCLELAVDAELEHPERGAEDHLVAVADEPATICGTCAFEKTFSL